MSSKDKKCRLGAISHELVFFCVAIFWLILDLWTKYLVYASMRVGQTIELPVSWLQLTYVRNCGGAFGVLEDYKVFFICAAIMTLACAYWMFPHLCRAFGYAGSAVTAVIVAGAVGNLYDRLRFGYVVDFLDLKWWPVFNVADIGITVGFTLFVYALFFTDRGKRLLDDGDSEEKSPAPKTDSSKDSEV